MMTTPCYLLDPRRLTTPPYRKGAATRGTLRVPSELYVIIKVEV